MQKLTVSILSKLLFFSSSGVDQHHTLPILALREPLRFQTYRKPGGEHFKIFFGCQAILGMGSNAWWIGYQAKIHQQSSFPKHPFLHTLPYWKTPSKGTHHKGANMPSCCAPTSNSWIWAAPTPNLSGLPRTFTVSHWPSLVTSADFRDISGSLFRNKCWK